MLEFKKRDEGTPIPRVHWNDVSDRFGELWVPDTTPHHSIIAQTGGGKSFLIGQGILPHIENEQVLIIDVKGDDPTYAEIGKPIIKIPKRGMRTFSDWLSPEKPREHWYRLVVSDDVPTARKQVATALETVYKEGNWTVVLDETRALTDWHEPNLGLAPYIERMWLRGRSRRIRVVAATQGPRWVPRSFYEQAQFHWIGAVEDEDSQKRLREIGGMERSHLEALKYLEQYHYIYTDRLSPDGVRFRAVTKVE